MSSKRKKRKKTPEYNLQDFAINQIPKVINWNYELKPRFQKLVENPNLADLASFHTTMIKIGDATSRHQDCPHCKKFQTYLDNVAGTFEYGGRMHDEDPEIKKIVSMSKEHLETVYYHFIREHHYVNPYKHRFIALLIIIALLCAVCFMFTLWGFVCVIASSVYIFKFYSKKDRANKENGIAWIWV